MELIGEPAALAQLATKIAAVTAAVTHVEKRGRNAFHNYDYATEADVLAAVRMACAEQKLAIIPSVSEQRVEDGPTTRQGAVQFRTDIVMSYTLICGDSGATATVWWAGTGGDTFDKGLYKAITGGNKYFLLKLFQLPTGDDPENEQHETSGTLSAPRRAAPAAAAGPSPTQLLSDSQKRKVFAELSKAGLDGEGDLHAILKQGLAGTESLNEVKKTQMDQLLGLIPSYAEWKAKQQAIEPQLPMASDISNLSPEEG